MKVWDLRIGAKDIETAVTEHNYLSQMPYRLLKLVQEKAQWVYRENRG